MEGQDEREVRMEGGQKKMRRKGGWMDESMEEEKRFVGWKERSKETKEAVGGK